VGDLKVRPGMLRRLTSPNLTRTFTNKEKNPPKKNLTMDAVELDTFSTKERTKSFRIEPKNDNAARNIAANRRLIETKMIEALREGVQTEGIFRKSGRDEVVNSLAAMLNKGEIKTWPSDDVIEIAAAYKAFFRLQQGEGRPLISDNDFAKLSPAYKGESLKRRVFAFKSVFKAMAPEDSLRLKEFLNLMAHTAKYSDVNKMTARNLAIVTAPNLFPLGLNPQDEFNKSQARQNLVESLILDTIEGRLDSVFL